MSLDQNNLMDTLRKLAADTSTDPNVLALVGKIEKWRSRTALTAYKFPRWLDEFARITIDYGDDDGLIVAGYTTPPSPPERRGPLARGRINGHHLHRPPQLTSYPFVGGRV